MPVIPLVTTAALAFVSVALWTVRVALTAAGRRGVGAVVAGVEAVTFVYAFARIVGNLDHGAGVVAYGAGVAAGTLVGLVIDERFAAGQSWVRIFAKGDGTRLERALTQRRWPVTSMAAHGPEGAVTQLSVAVDNGRLGALTRDLEELAPGVFWTSERVRRAHIGPLPHGLHQVGVRHRPHLRHHRSRQLTS